MGRGWVDPKTAVRHEHGHGIERIECPFCSGWAVARERDVYGAIRTDGDGVWRPKRTERVFGCRSCEELLLMESDIPDLDEISRKPTAVEATIIEDRQVIGDEGHRG